jgi:very-short-patch-repair endonuclease
MVLTNKDFLRVVEMACKRWCELFLKELKEDIEKIDTLDVFEQVYLRSYWGEQMDRIFENFEEKTDDFDKKYLSIYRMLGEKLPVPTRDLKIDVANRLEWMKRRVARDYERSVKETINLHRIISPIEQIFLMEWKYSKAEERFNVKIIPREKINTTGGTFEIDFLIKSSDDQTKLKLAIELDGHEFHEKTKEQVIKDKRKERAIISSGFPILRFSGAEIVRNVRACIEEIISYLEKQKSKTE